MADNPFSKENNPFSMGEGGGGDMPGGDTKPQGGGPFQGGDQGAPAPVDAETTKPRQMPGGASPTGAPMGMSMPAMPAPAAMPGMGAAPAPGATPMPMTTTTPSGGANVPQPSASARSAVHRAIAIRDEVLAANPDLDPVEAFTLAKRAVALQVTASDPLDPMDRSQWTGANHPMQNPNHPYWRTPAGRRRINQGFGPAAQGGQGGYWMPRGSGYNENDPSWARKSRDMGYTGDNPALVGGAATLIEHLWNKWKGRGGNGTPPSGNGTPPTPAPSSNSPNQPGAHTQQGQGPGVTVLPGVGTGPGRHQVPPVATGPVPGVPHTQPGGPPTPHPGPVQPGQPSMPAQRQQQRGQGFDWQSLLPGGNPGAHRERPIFKQDPSKANQDVLPYGRGRGRHRAASLTASLVYGED